MGYYSFLQIAGIINTGDTPVENTLDVAISPRTLGGVFSFTPTIASTIYWAVYASNELQKSKSDILSGTGSVTFGSVELYQTTLHKGFFSGLAANTSYRLHFYTVDTGSSDESNSFRTDVFTTTDQINMVNGVSFDVNGQNGNDTTKSIPNNTNIGGNWTQVSTGNQPTFDPSNGDINFDGNDYLNGANQYLNPKGFNIFLVFNRTSDATHYLISEVGLQTFRSSVSITTTTVDLDISGRTGPSFGYVVGTGLKMLRIEYNGATTYNLYDESNILVDTQEGSQLNAFAPIFNRIGGGQGQEAQGINGTIKRITILDSIESGVVNYLFQKIKAVNYSETESESGSNLVTIGLKTLLLAGDSMASGFDQLSNLTGVNTGLTAPVQTGYVMSSISYDIVRYQPSDSHTGEIDTDTFGNELGYLWENYENTNDHALVIKYAIPSTTLEARAGTDNDWNSSLATESYFKFERVAKTALQIAKSNLFEITETPVKLHVGTNDAQDQTWATNYEANITDWITQFINDFGDNKVIIPQITSRDYSNLINASLQKLSNNSVSPESIPQLLYLTNNISYQKKADGIHLTSDALIEEGRDTYDAATTSISNLPAPTGLTLTQNAGVLTLNYSQTSEPNIPPLVTDINVTGTEQEAEVLTAVATYEIQNPGVFSSLTWQWYRADNKDDDGTVIVGATNATYTLVAADVSKFVYPSVIVNQTGGANTASSEYKGRKSGIIISIPATGPRTFKVNFGNTLGIQTVAGYNNKDGNNDGNGEFIDLETDDGTPTVVRFTTFGSWSGFTGADTSNAGTGDLQSDLLVSGYRTGANSFGNRAFIVSNLNPDRYYRFVMTAVGTASDVTNYNASWRLNGRFGDPLTLGDTTAITIDPVAEKANPTLHEIARNIRPSDAGIIQVDTQEPGAFDSIISTLIIEETETQI